MSLVERAKGLLFHPHAGWPVVAREHIGAGRLVGGYAASLAAIGPAAAVIGLSVVGVSIVFGGPAIRFPFGAVVAYALTDYVLTLGVALVLAGLADALALPFGGQRDMNQALKLVIFSLTAGWLAGVFRAVPLLGILSWVGMLYGIFLFHAGAHALMRVPAEKVLGYTVAVTLAGAVLFLLISFISNSLLPVPEIVVPARK